MSEGITSARNNLINTVGKKHTRRRAFTYTAVFTISKLYKSEGESTLPKGSTLYK
jgi:hypothetical protein